MKLTRAVEVFRDAMETLGIVGELNVQVGQIRSVTWLGKPGPHDMIVTVVIMKADP